MAARFSIFTDCQGDKRREKRAGLILQRSCKRTSIVVNRLAQVQAGAHYMVVSDTTDIKVMYLAGSCA